MTTIREGYFRVCPLSSLKKKRGGGEEGAGEGVKVEGEGVQVFTGQFTELDSRLECINKLTSLSLSVRSNNVTVIIVFVVVVISLSGIFSRSF